MKNATSAVLAVASTTGIAAAVAAALTATIALAPPATAEPTTPDPFSSVERWNPGLIFEPSNSPKSNDMSPRLSVREVHTVRQVGDPGRGPKPMAPRIK